MRIKLTLLFLASLICLFVDAQVRIPMEKQGGVYLIPCTVNGARMKFIFDTGAASVCLSESMAAYLLENNYLSLSDFKGSGLSSIADGRTILHTEINLRDIEIAGLHIKNIRAVIVPQQNAPLLLGQSAIQTLGSVTIDGSTLIINGAPSNVSDDLIKHIREEASKWMKAKMWTSAVECYDQLSNHIELSDEDNFNYGYSLYNCRKYEEASLRFMKVKVVDAFCNKGVDFHGWIGYSFLYSNQLEYAVSSFEKSLYFHQKRGDTEGEIQIQLALADAYGELRDAQMASKMYTKVLDLEAKRYHVDKDYIGRDCLGKLYKGEHSIKTDRMQKAFFNSFYYAYHGGGISYDRFYALARQAAQQGNIYAQRYIEKLGQSWY